MRFPRALSALTLGAVLIFSAAAAQAYTPNDPYNYLQWNFGQIGMGDAWDLNMGGSSDVTVAVIDTGYVLTSDLAQTNFDLANAWDFVEGDSDPQDENGHGTHVIGTIAQSTDNGIGVSGIAYNTTILPIKAFGADRSSTEDRVAAAIYLAIEAGADIINMSFGGGASSILEEACLAAYNTGVLLVAASGNDGESSLNYPAAYSSVLAVGATKYDMTLASYSNHASDMVVAPGGDTSVDQNGDGYGDGIAQQINNGEYWFKDGTSMAAPHVSGVAALILAEAYDLGLSIPSKSSARVDWLVNVLTSTTLDLGSSGQDSTYGYGLIRAENALRSLNGL